MSAFARHFSPFRFWTKVRRLARRLGYDLLERLLWLFYAAQHEDTPAWAKAKCYAALGYFVAPVDGVPDALPGGLADDAAVLAVALAAVAAYVNDDVREQAAETLRTWFGKR